MPFDSNSICIKMKKTAMCACTYASITVDANPTMHGVCHCSNCQRRSGSAFGISAYFSKSSVVERTGETRIYAFHHAAQDHEQERHFCARCGTTLFWYVSTMPGLIGIAAGCFADDALAPPSYSVSHSKKKSWLTLPSDWKIHHE